MKFFHKGEQHHYVHTASKKQTFLTLMQCPKMHGNVHVYTIGKILFVHHCEFTYLSKDYAACLVFNVIINCHSNNAIASPHDSELESVGSRPRFLWSTAGAIPTSCMFRTTGTTTQCSWQSTSPMDAWLEIGLLVESLTLIMKTFPMVQDPNPT